VLISDEARALDEQSLQVWHEESMNLKDETADAYMMRIDTRKIRYALLFSILECYDQHGRFADAITLTGTAMQRAIEVCEFYKTHSLHFLVKAKAIKPKAPNEKEPLPVQLKNKLIELGGTADSRKLYYALNWNKQTFMTALKPLLDTQQVVLTKRKNTKGRNVVVVSIPKKMQNGYDSMTVMTVCKINTTVTSPKPQNASHCHKSHCHNAYDSVATQPTVPGQVNPEPTVPEPMPEPEPEPEPPQPMPAPEPETEPTIPGPTVPEPEHVQKIVRLVLSYLEDFWSCKKIPGEPFRRHVAKISGRYENAVWKLLFPAHVVKLHTTDFFILRDDKHRPKGFEGLIDDKGVLPCDEPALF
jgi:hypothetical protein